MIYSMVQFPVTLSDR